MVLKPRHNELLDIIAKKDEQISSLETQIQAYAARTSNIQTRLLSTLDTLDTLHHSHTYELTSEIKAKDKLSEKLDHCIEYVKAAESERDDLRDAVGLLIEKVELSNNYSLWPHNRLRISNLLDPPLGIQAPHKGSKESDERILLYAAAMVASLRSERDSERRAHQQTRHDAESRIAVLEAQLARREAELESCIIAHTAECIQLPQRLSQSEVKPMQQSEATQVLELTSTVNRSLEAEVNFLAHRLEKERLSPQTPLEHVSRPTPRQPSAPAGPSRPPQRSTSPPHSSPQHSPSASEDDYEPPIQAPVPTRPHQQSDEMQIMREFERQVAALSSEVDAFRAERDLLAEIISKERMKSPPTNNTGGNLFDEHLSIEQECGRLRESEQELRQRLEFSSTAAMAREKELLDEIDRLRGTTRDWAHSEQLLPLNDDSGGEQSMDLASPLQPTILLADTSDAPSELFDIQYIDAPSIPLPESPEPPSPLKSERSPTPTLPLHLREYQDNPEGESNMQRIERELAAARREAEERSQALNDLRGVVEDLKQKLNGGAGLER